MFCFFFSEGVFTVCVHVVLSYLGISKFLVDNFFLGVTLKDGLKKTPYSLSRPKGP